MPLEPEYEAYVYLCGEGVDVWRPARARWLGPDLYQLLGEVPEGEVWQFQPGDVVQCVLRGFEGEPLRHLVAVKKLDLTLWQ